MRGKSADSAMQLIRRGIAAKSSPLSASHNFNQEKRRFSRTPTVDFSSIHEVNDAICLFREMVRMSPQPSVRLYSKLLSVIAKMEEYFVALSMFDEMRRFGVPVDEYKMNMAINCCCHLNRVECAFAILGSFFKDGYKPNVTTFTTLLKGLYLAGKVAKAETLIKKVLTLKLCEPNDVMILTVVNGFCKAGQSLNAINFLHVFEKTSCKPNAHAYNAVIDGLSKAGMVDDALQLLSKMTKKGISPNIFTYSSIILGLCAVGRWNEVKCLLLIDMVDHKVSLDVTGFTILVDAFCKEGKMKG